MKNFTFILVGSLIFLASCSTGNMAFSKRKYTKGKYKPEKNDYKVAKSDNKSDDTKYVVKTEKNPSKQNYKVSNSKVKKEETVAKRENTPVVKEVKNEKVQEVAVVENKNQNVVFEDQVTEVKTTKVDEPVIENSSDATPNTPKKAPADAAEILGYIGFAFGLLALLVAILGFLPYFFAYGAIGLGIIGLGCSIASWIIGGKTVWNFWGVIASAVAIALAILWAILWGVGIL